MWHRAPVVALECVVLTATVGVIVWCAPIVGFGLVVAEAAAWCAWLEGQEDPA